MFNNYMLSNFFTQTNITLLLITICIYLILNVKTTLNLFYLSVLLLVLNVVLLIQNAIEPVSYFLLLGELGALFLFLILTLKKKSIVQNNYVNAHIFLLPVIYIYIKQTYSYDNIYINFFKNTLNLKFNDFQSLLFTLLNDIKYLYLIIILVYLFSYMIIYLPNKYKLAILKRKANNNFFLNQIELIVLSKFYTIQKKFQLHTKTFLTKFKK